MALTVTHHPGRARRDHPKVWIPGCGRVMGDILESGHHTLVLLWPRREEIQVPSIRYRATVRGTGRPCAF